uniref:RNA polymerase-associated protein RTF1 n=2 Tax=Anthurium amnicola TaxID=1678845 RepID=A0A1D1Y9F6_9ARAE
MEDLEMALNPTSLCGRLNAKNYSGAGANAAPIADGPSVTTSLFEVVWSPRRGLSLKCPDPSLIQKKAPILWSTEVLNITIAPPPPADDGGKSESSRFVSGENSTKVYLQPCSEEKINHEETSLGSPQNTISMVQTCPLGSHEHNPVWKLCHKSALPGTSGDMKTMNKIPVVNVTNVNSPSENKDKDTSSPRKNQLIKNNASPDVVSSAGLEDGRIGDCLFHKPEKASSNLAQIEADHRDSNELWEHIEGGLEENNNRDSAKGEALVYDTPLLNKWSDPKDLGYGARFIDVKQSKSEDISSVHYNNGVIPHSTYLHPLAGHCAQILDFDALGSRHSSFKILIEAKNEHYNEDMVVTSEPSNEGKKSIHSICQKGESPLIESSSNANVNTLNQCKVKEAVSSTGKTSNEKKGSYESVESNNNTEPFVTGKRIRGFGQEMLVGNKRTKKSSDKTSCSKPHVREGSSFVNWISSVTNGLFRSDNVEGHSLALVPCPVSNKQRDIFSTAMSNDSNTNDASRSVGFGSIFNALYYPGLNGKSKTENTYHSGESGSSRDLQFDKMTVVSNNNGVLHDDMGIKMHEPVPISSVRMDHGVGERGEPPTVVPNSYTSNCLLPEKVKDNIGEDCDLHYMGCSTSSLRNGTGSSSDGKEAGKPSSFILNNSSNLTVMDNASGIPASIWITRFAPKVVAPMECNTQYNQSTFLKAKKHIDDCNMFLNNSKNDIDSVRDCNNSDNCHQSLLEDQRHISERPQQCSINTMDLFCSQNVHADLKVKSHLNPILPSQKSKKLEPITSVFAKRLDAFRHIQTSEVADNLTPESATCFFCGKSSHIITSCSDVNDSELEDLLQNINSLGRTQNRACLCIRCFQNDHWALVCPHASVSHHHGDGNASIINSENVVRTIKGGIGSPLLTNHGTGIHTKNEGQQSQLLGAHRIPYGDKRRNATEFMLQTNGSVDKKSAMKGKQIVSSSGEIELGDDKSFVHFHNLVTSKKPDEQPRIFERLQKLRLSRTDVIRWMESSTCHFGLDGFFLRVRLGKGEEDLGGTCYHVACICGTSGEKLHGGYKNHLPVNIGGSQCLIHCCFISNHDFAEDELKAWWSATLRRGGKLPSEKDLDKKLQERKNLDFSQEGTHNAFLFLHSNSML